MKIKKEKKEEENKDLLIIHYQLPILLVINIMFLGIIYNT